MEIPENVRNVTVVVSEGGGSVTVVVSVSQLWCQFDSFNECAMLQHGDIRITTGFDQKCQF